MIAPAGTCRPVTDQVVVSINTFDDDNLRTTCFFCLRLFSKDSFLNVQILIQQQKSANTLILLVNTFLIVQLIVRLNENCTGYKKTWFTSLLAASLQQIFVP